VVIKSRNYSCTELLKLIIRHNVTIQRKYKEDFLAHTAITRNQLSQYVGCQKFERSAED
jgi:hypothetical protein